MYVREIMTPAPIVCGPNDTVDYAAKLMLNHNVGEIPVCDGAIVIGVVTDRDITVRATATGKSPTQIEVRALMTQPVYTAGEFDLIERAAELMEAQHIRRVPVVDRNWRLVGILSQTDLARNGHDRPRRLLPASGA